VDGIHQMVHFAIAAQEALSPCTIKDFTNSLSGKATC